MTIFDTTDIKSLSSYHAKLAEISIPSLIEGILKNGEYVVIGGNIIGFYTKPRATLDVDILTDAQTFKKIKTELEKREVKFKFSGDAIETEENFDVLNAGAHPLWGAVLKDRVVTNSYFIPTREGLIALKYLAAISPNRSYGNKQQDVTDMINLLDKADRGKLLQYISILGGQEKELFQKSVLNAFDNKETIII